MSALTILESALKAFSLSPLQTVFEPPQQLRSYTQALAVRYGAANSDLPRQDRMPSVLRKLLTSGQIDNGTDLRYACYGITQEVGPARQRVISTPVANTALLARVKSIAGDKRRLRRCYQGLLASYFSFDGRNAEEPARTEWLKLRNFLRENLAGVASREPIPEWLQLVRKHENLFGDSPCSPYSKQLLEGNTEEFDAVTNGLGILDQSWLVQEAAYATIRAACDWSHHDFLNKVRFLLQLLKDHPLIQSRGLALILIRYTDVPGTPEDPTLLQFALSIWKNPLSHRNLVNWSLAGDKATRMVVQWLKSTLIADFFEYLSADGATNNRRVKFWKQYVNSIESMYFALGRSAMRSNDEDVKRLRKLMGDNLLRMEGGSPSNNGFFMLMRGRVIAEFGEHGNAVYVFHQDHLPFELRGTIVGTGRTAWKSLPGVHYLSHMDNGHNHGRWEQRFKEYLSQNFNIQPDTPTRRTLSPANASTISVEDRAEHDALRAFCAKRGVPFDVLEGGRLLVVRTGATNLVMANHLEGLGFSYNRRDARWERRR